MQSPLGYYILLAKRWTWLVVLGIVICGLGTYLGSKLVAPVYRASSTLTITLNSSTSAYDNISASQLVAATYAQLITSPEMLRPVLAHHPGITLEQFTTMVTAKAQPNTSIIEIAVDNSKPELAAQLANELAENFSYYANNQLHYASSQLSGEVRISPASTPIVPIKPRPLTYGGIGALVGLGLSLGLIVLFEWADDRLKKPEEIQDVLELDTLAVIPKLSARQRQKKAEDMPIVAEKYRMLCANLKVAQSNKHFKLVMVTSAMAGEGRTSTAASLATFLAKTGKRVLLVDADLRHPTIEQRFPLKDERHTHTAFRNTFEQLDEQQEGYETDIPTLRVLTIGIHSYRPAELLQSPLTSQLFENFNKTSFDYIIFDSSPLLPVVDAQILASYVQVAVLVVDASKTSRRTILRAKRVLSKANTNILGVVINRSRWPDDDDSLEYLRATRHFASQKSIFKHQTTTDRISSVLPDTPVPMEEKAAIARHEVSIDDAIDEQATTAIIAQHQQSQNGK